MRICPHCGNVVENDNAKYCKKCGKELPPVAKQEVPPVIPSGNVGQGQGINMGGDVSGPIGGGTNGYTGSGAAGYNGGSSNYVSYDQRLHPRPPRPSQHLLAAILSTLFCCLPTGIYAIVCSTKVDSYYDSGDYDSANLYSEKARKWSLYPAIIAGIAYVLFVVIIVIAAIAEDGGF